MAAIITIGIDPMIEFGPLSIAWHGLMIAVGIGFGWWLAAHYARERGLDENEILTLAVVVAIAGIVGARAFFLFENDAAALLDPGEWLGTRGFAFWGAIILSIPAVALYLRRRALGMPYLDALAAGFPLGMAVGRIGDIINGEHFGPASDLPWAIRYTHPDALVPGSELAYHSGGLYESLLALVMLAIVWPLRDRLRSPGLLLATVVGVYSAGRFVMFFYRSDSEALAAGLNGAQWTSLVMLSLAIVGAALSMRRDARAR